VRSDIVPGAPFPDYELTDHTRTRRRLSDLQGNDPMVLILSRGHFCPKDHQQHLELAAFYPKLAVAYTKIVTITTDNLLETGEFRDSVGAQWPFLSDPGRKIQKDLEIQEYTDPHHDPMIPHTLVLEPAWSSTSSTTATGSGGGRRRRSCAWTCARSPARSAPTGT
jgi:peroxiredoxin